MFVGFIFLGGVGVVGGLGVVVVGFGAGGW